MAQAVIGRSHTAEARVRSEVSPCAICEGQVLRFCDGQWHWDKCFGFVRDSGTGQVLRFC